MKKNKDIGEGWWWSQACKD